MPRRCTVCIHKQVKAINRAICNSDSYRNISKQYGVGHVAVFRHLRTCLNLKAQEVAGEHRVKQAVNVYDEFTEQLEFAKSLRNTAQAYLSDPDDPFNLIIGPQAHEIEVLYYDFNNCDDEGRPRKAKAKLNQLLAEMAGRGIEAYRVEMKSVDIRKFALDAISTADVCIDKFARMGGAYQKDKSNEQDVSALIDGLVDRLIAKGWERAAARHFAEQKYGGGVPLQITNGS